MVTIIVLVSIFVLLGGGKRNFDQMTLDEQCLAFQIVANDDEKWLELMEELMAYLGVAVDFENLDTAFNSPIMGFFESCESVGVCPFDTASCEMLEEMRTQSEELSEFIDNSNRLIDEIRELAFFLYYFDKCFFRVKPFHVWNCFYKLPEFRIFKACIAENRQHIGIYAANQI